MRLYVGLGSNLCSPLTQLSDAVAALACLPIVKRLRSSAVYRSPPWGGVAQSDFYNIVLSLDIHVGVQAFLLCTQAIEHQQGRVREQHWGPRCIDIDILYAEGVFCETENLLVPHRWLAHRAFVLRPWMDVAPYLTLPCGHSVSAAYESLEGEAISCVLDAGSFDKMWGGVMREVLV